MNILDLKTKILITIIFLSVSVVGYLSYQRTLVERDFEIFDSEAETEEDSFVEDALPTQEEDAPDIIEESATTSTSTNS